MILRFLDVAKQFGANTLAVDGVTCEIPKGQFCVVLGTSGAGKSTLLRMVNGMVAPSGGSLEFDGKTVTTKTLRAIQPRIAMVHQQFHLVSRLSVLQNVLAGSLPRVATWRSLLGLFPKAYQRRACRLLSDVGLREEHLYRRAMHLSGGQQQRVAIARAFILEPDLVLADEPVASLDPETSRVILQLLRTASRSHGATVLCSLHQVELAVEFADRIIGMKGGRLVFDGPPQDLDAAAIASIYSSSQEQHDAADKAPPANIAEAVRCP